MPFKNPQFKQKYGLQIDQTKASCEQIIREKFKTKKIEKKTLIDKRELHFILNSFIHGDIFSEDILNEFWDHNFHQTAMVNDIIKTYNNGIIYVLEKIIQDNIKIFYLEKDRQKSKQAHNYKSLNSVIVEIDELNQEINQFTSDLFELSKPFDINLLSLIQKYKPIIAKEKKGLEKNQPNQNQIQENAFDMLQNIEISSDAQPRKVVDELKTQEKYYRFVVYLSVVVFIGDLSVCLSKYNFIDLITNILLLLNSFLEHYILQQDQFQEKLNYITVNYAEAKLVVEEGQAIFKFRASVEEEHKPREHLFQKYTYSTICMMLAVIIFDGLWVLLQKDHFFYSEGSQNALLLSCQMWKYNHYVVYTSIVTLIFKTLIILLLTRAVDFQWSKLFSRFNFIMNFIRFTNLTYITDLMKIYE